MHGANSRHQSPLLGWISKAKGVVGKPSHWASFVHSSLEGLASSCSQAETRFRRRVEEPPIFSASAPARCGSPQQVANRLHFRGEHLPPLPRAAIWRSLDANCPLTNTQQCARGSWRGESRRCRPLRIAPGCAAGPVPYLARGDELWPDVALRGGLDRCASNRTGCGRDVPTRSGTVKSSYGTGSVRLNASATPAGGPPASSDGARAAAGRSRSAIRLRGGTISPASADRPISPSPAPARSRSA